MGRNQTIDDVIKFVLARAPDVGEVLEVNPFQGKKFKLETVEEALLELNQYPNLHDLMPYDLKGTMGLWKQAGEINTEYVVAALTQLIKTKQKSSNLPLSEIFPRISQDDLRLLPINRFATNLSGLFSIFQSSPYDTIRFLIDKDPKFSEYSDFQVYDMAIVPQRTWDNPLNITKVMGLFIEELQKRHPDDTIEKILSNMSYYDFDIPINRYGTKAMPALNRLNNRIYSAVRILIEKDSKFAQFSDFMPFDMHKAPAYTWTKADGTLNYELIHIAGKQLIGKLIEQNPNLSLPQIFSSLNMPKLDSTKINRYGTTLGELVSHQFLSSPYLFAMELINNIPEFSECSDLMPYHMKRSGNNTNRNKDGSNNYELGRLAFKEFLGYFKDPNESVENMLTRMILTDFKKFSPPKYGSNLISVITHVYSNSVFTAIRDLVENDPEYSSYADIMPYDMKHAPSNTWVKKDGSKNFELARKASNQLIMTLGKPIEDIKAQEFISTPINRYGTTLGNMVHGVYNSSVDAAIKDVINSYIFQANKLDK